MDHPGRLSRGEKEKDQRKNLGSANIYGKSREEQLIKRTRRSGQRVERGIRRG